jgi:hypothetical protein
VIPAENRNGSNVLFRIPGGLVAKILDFGESAGMYSIVNPFNVTTVLLRASGVSDSVPLVTFGRLNTTTRQRTGATFLPSTTTVSSSHIRKVGQIPHIIHQTWKGVDVPISMRKYIESWRKYHPHWEYWFWRDEDISEFVKSKYHWFIDTYNSYSMPIMKADVFRYLVLHEFGGVYADLDMECLRPLDDFVATRSCILSQEPLEHAVLIYGRERLACNALMACKPKHPFFKWLIHELPKIKARHSQRNDSRNVMSMSGPIMLETSLQVYERNLTDKRNRNVTIDQDSEVHVASPTDLMPIFDSGQSSMFRAHCRKRKNRRHEVCRGLKRRGFSNRVSKKSYTVHHWIHFWAGWWKKGYGNSTNIRNMITDFVNVTTRGIF